MTITRTGDILRVGQISELATATANPFQSELAAALTPGVRRIDIDFSQTNFVDCGGLGALVAIRKCARTRNSNVRIRLLEPPRSLERMMTLMRLDQMFQLEQRQVACIQTEPAARNTSERATASGTCTSTALSAD